MELLIVRISVLPHTMGISASVLLAMNWHRTARLAKVSCRYFTDLYLCRNFSRRLLTLLEG